jgi:non-specific serine/threonine protein kinase/serine/threonine-protein kinase
MLHEVLTGRRPGTFGREQGRKRLSSDLDNILDMALRKESQRRYGSVEQLSEDIRRHLEGMPVLARKDTWWYRSGKFVKRHRVGLAATLLVGVALCASTTMAVMKAQQLANRVSLDQKLASLFLVDVHDAIARLPGSTPAREVLLSQSLKYLNELAPEASGDVAMRKSLALAYERFADLQSGAVTGGLGQASAALRTYRRAQDIREEVAAAHPNDRGVQLQLAESYLLAGVIAGRAGGADKRVEYDRKSLAILERLNAQDPANRTYRAALARAHTGIAYSLSHDDLWRESRQHLHRALELRKTLSDEAANDNRARRSLALIYYRLGVNYAQSRQPNEAVQFLDNALALQSALAQEDRQNRQLRSDIASTQHFLAVCLNMMNRHAEALPHLHSAITRRESMLAEDSRDARTRSLLAGNYAERSTALLHLDKPQAALAAAQRAVDLQNFVVSLDPQGVPVRVSAADFHARAGAAHAALAGRPGAGSADHLAQAIAMYERAVGFYDRLQEQGHLRSKNSIEDAENARREAQRLKSSGIRAAIDE